MALFKPSDDALSASIVLLRLSGGQLAGTGVAITQAGVLLTCHHVAAYVDLIAVDSLGRRFSTKPIHSTDDILAQADIGFLQIAYSATDIPIFPAPILAECLGDSFETRVMISANFAECIPLSGRLERSTIIRYETDAGTPYGPISASPISGISIKRGMSGAPIWDATFQAIVGLIAVGVVDDNIGGFGIPLMNAHTSSALLKFARENNETISRFGRAPNSLAVRSISSQVSLRSKKVLESRGIYLPDKMVERGFFLEAVNQFLVSSASIFPVIGNAGQGKTTALANLVDELEDFSVLLLRAAAAKPGETSSEYLEREVNLAASILNVKICWSDIEAAANRTKFSLTDLILLIGSLDADAIQQHATFCYGLENIVRKVGFEEAKQSKLLEYIESRILVFREDIIRCLVYAACSSFDDQAKESFRHWLLERVSDAPALNEILSAALDIYLRNSKIVAPEKFLMLITAPVDPQTLLMLLDLYHGSSLEKRRSIVLCKLKIMQEIGESTEIKRLQAYLKKLGNN